MQEYVVLPGEDILLKPTKERVSALPLYGKTVTSVDLGGGHHPLSKLSLYFATYTQVLQGTLKVYIYKEERNFFKRFFLDMSEIADNSEVIFDLEEELTVDSLSIEFLPEYNVHNRYNIALWLSGGLEPCINIFSKEKETLVPLKEAPKIALLTPLYHVPTEVLKQTVASVFLQNYPCWEWCIVVDTGVPLPDEQKELLEQIAKDDRVCIIDPQVNQGISLAQNVGLDRIEKSGADWFLTLDHDDMLHPDALLRIAERIIKNPGTHLIYADENKCNEDGSLFFEEFKKPDWSPALLLCQNYICHPCAISCKHAKGLRYDTNYDGAQDHKFFLDFLKRYANIKVQHIPRVLYHWRVLKTSTSGGIDVKPLAAINGAKAVGEFLGEKVFSVLRHPRRGGVLLRPILKNKKKSIRVVIPSKDHFDIVKSCLYSLSQTESYNGNKMSFSSEGMYQAVVVDNGSSDKKLAIRTYEESLKGVKVFYGEYPFNFSTQSNMGAKGFKGDYLLFLNNDTEACHPSWMMRLSSWLDHFPDVAAVGAKLLYPNGALQHGGVEVYSNGTAGHTELGLPFGDSGYFDRVETTHEVSAVTGACLLVRRSVFEEVQGFDEDLPEAFNDVDLCLRIRKKGYRILYTPESVLLHHESLTRGKANYLNETFPSAVAFMGKRWQGVVPSDDPYAR